MPTIRQIVFGLVVAAGMLFPRQVLADRDPTPEERSQIETMLRNEGYTDWGAIALDDDDDIWEVDEAYASNGRKYALKLSPGTFAIIQREPDDD
jgi:Peptidase propeptide and YPEB domain